jgi:hypothetical protein
VDGRQSLHQLADALERFNRKERNLLIRDALGHQHIRIPLSDDFRQRVAKVLDLQKEIPEDAWWGTDYHFDWLAGALALHFGDDCVCQTGRPNSHGDTKSKRLVQGNQEDIDLLLATGQDLILIEAKAYSGWSESQLNSKLARIELLRSYKEELAQSSDRKVRLHFLLMSDRRPETWSPKWPDGVEKNSEVRHLDIHLENHENVLAVSRCDENGKRSASGDRWRIIRYKQNRRPGTA